MHRKLAMMAMLALAVMFFLSATANARPIEINVQSPVAPVIVDQDAPPVDDFIREGHTYLNVLRHSPDKYFIKLKKQFQSVYDPDPSLKRYFGPTSASVPHGSILVVMGVAIDKDGNLADLFVFKSSGLPEFDEEAMRTVRASCPFETPPAKLLGDDSVLRMSWTFQVYL